jgi:hypothetical protein
MQSNTPSVVARFYWISITQTSAMSYSISTLLTRNLHDVFGENDPARRRAAIAEIFTEDCVFYEPRGVYRGRDAIDRVAGAIKATHPGPRNWAMAGGSNGYRAALVRRQLMPGLISSLLGTAGLPPFIFSSTSYLMKGNHDEIANKCSARARRVG